MLGLYEPRAAAIMDTPRGLQGSHKAAGSFDHLSEWPLFTTLKEAEAVLLGEGCEDELPPTLDVQAVRKQRWKEWDDRKQDESEQKWAFQYSGNYVSPTEGGQAAMSAVEARMRWGR